MTPYIRIFVVVLYLRMLLDMFNKSSERPRFNCEWLMVLAKRWSTKECDLWCAPITQSITHSIRPTARIRFCLFDERSQEPMAYI